MNMKHGQGVLQDADGGTFKGSWEGNLRVGTGTFVIPGGKGEGGVISNSIAVRVFAL